MKILKYFLIIILIIIVIPLIIGLFIPNEFHVKREIVIGRSPEVVFEYIRSLKNQDQFSVWAQMDPDMKTQYTGIDGEVGAVSSWESEDENVGKGSQEITQLVKNERIETKLRFIEPFNSESDAYFTTEPEDANSTRVTWGITGKFSYPMNTMLLIYDMDEAMGKDLEQGLKNLKRKLEK